MSTNNNRTREPRRISTSFWFGIPFLIFSVKETLFCVDHLTKFRKPVHQIYLLPPEPIRRGLFHVFDDGLVEAALDGGSLPPQTAVDRPVLYGCSGDLVFRLLHYILRHGVHGGGETNIDTVPELLRHLFGRVAEFPVHVFVLLVLVLLPPEAGEDAVTDGCPAHLGAVFHRHVVVFEELLLNVQA